MANGDPPSTGTLQALTPDQAFQAAIVALKGDKLQQKVEQYLASQFEKPARELLQQTDVAANQVLDAVEGIPLAQAALKTVATSVVKGMIAANAPTDETHNRAAIEADPIELASGQLEYSHVDLAIDGAGIRFEFIRRYRSQARYPNGPLGAAWDHNYNMWLREVDPNTIAVGTGELREDRYHRVSPGAPDIDYFAAESGKNSIIIQNGQTGKFELRTPSGVSYQFADLGALSPDDTGLHRLERIFDRFQLRNALTGEPQPPGNYLRFAYDPGDPHLLTSIEVNHLSRKILLDYDDLGRLIALTDYCGRRVLYEYDDYDDLVAVTLPPTQDRRLGRSTFYEYSTASGPIPHLLTDVVDANGRRYLEVEYGTGEGFVDRQRVIRQRDSEGEWLLQYADLDITRDPNDPPDPDVPARYTCVVQPNGHVIEYWFNELGGVLFKADEYRDGENTWQRAVWWYQYNPDGNLIASLTPEGVFTQHFYGRDEHLLLNGGQISDALNAGNVPAARQRLSFGLLRATIRRPKLPAALLTWPDSALANSIATIRADDIVQVFTYEADVQLPLRVSDPRATADLFAAPGNWLSTYEYSADDRKLPVSIGYPATTQPDGTVTPATQELFKCDANGRIVDHTDAQGHVTHTDYYPDAKMAGGPDLNFDYAIVQPNVVSLGGYRQATTAGMGEPTAGTMTFEVNRRGITTKMTDERGGVTSYRVDTTDQPIEVSRTLKPGVQYVTSSAYTGQAKLARTEQPILNDAGAPVFVDGIALGTAVQRFHYTDIEQVQRQSIGGLELRTSLTTYHVYNQTGLPTRHFSPKGSVSRTGYDRRKLPTSTTIGYGTNAAIVVKTLFDRDGRRIATVDGRDCMTRFEYDSFGRLAQEIQIVDIPVGTVDTRPLAARHGHTKALRYDKMDNVVLERFFEWRTGDDYHLLTRTRFEFNERGQKIKEIRDWFDGPRKAGPPGLDAFENAPPAGAMQVESWYFVDGTGRVIERRGGVVAAGPDASPGSCVSRQYDHSGREISASTRLLDRGGLEVTRTETTYDLHGNPLRTDRFDFEYDGTGTLTNTEVMSHGAEYDALDRKVAEIDGLGNRITHRYDSRDLILETTDPLGNRTSFDYDIYGRRHRVTESPAPMLKNISAFEFDADGQAIALVRGDETNAALATISYAYNAAHKKILETLGIGTPLLRTTHWRYDEAGNLAERIQPTGLALRMNYDRVNRLEAVSFDGTNLVAPNPAVHGAALERFEHDGLGRVMFAETGQGAAPVTSVTTEYDSLGHPRVEVQSLQGEPDLTIHRSFDARSLLSELEYPSKHTFRFHCDLAGRLERVEDTTRGTPNVGLPGAGARDVLTRAHVGHRRRAEAFASGVRTVRSYDGAGRLMIIDHQDGTKGSLLNLVTLYDAGGNVRMDWQLGSQVLSPVTSYDYDGMNRLRQAGASAVGAPPVATFAPPSAPINPLAGQTAIDGAIQLPGAATRSFQYDAGSNRIAETVSGVLNPVDSLDRRQGPTYDDAGNPVAVGTESLSFDGRNRLVGWTDGVTKFEAIYDALGRRVSMDAEGVKTRFAFEGMADVAEYRNGPLFAESLVTSAPDGRALLFYQGDELVIHSDRLHSTRMVTGSSGTAAGRYDFDPFGQMDIGSVDLPALRHRFMGREWDPAIMLYHFRARHYDPSVGAFLQRDPVDKLTSESAYRAFASNPLIYVDPMGTTSSHPGDDGAWPRAWHPGEPVPEVGAIESVKAVLKGWIYEQLHPSPKELFGLSTRLMIDEVHGPDGVGFRQIYDADRHQIVMQTLVDPSNRAAVDRVSKANEGFMFSPSGGLGQLIHMAGATVLQAAAMWEGLGGFGGRGVGAEMRASPRAAVTRAGVRTAAPIDTILVRKTVPIEELHFIRESGTVGRPGKWTYVTRPFDMRRVAGFEPVSERLTLNYEGSTFRDTAMEMELRIPNRFRIGPGTQKGVGFTEGGAWDLTAPAQPSSSILRFRIHYPGRTSRWISGNPFE